MRVVLDVNILVSAALSAQGAPAQLVRAVRGGLIDAVVSPGLLGELRDVLQRDRFRKFLSKDEASSYVEEIAALCEIVTDPATGGGATRDPKDDYIVGIALEADAELIISGDRDLLEADAPGVEVMTPRAAADRLFSGLAIAHDWWDAGWVRFLPRQATELHMLVLTATLRGLSGDLDDLIPQILPERPERWDELTGGLEGPVWWSFPDETDDAEQRALDREAQSRFETTIAATEWELPRTVRDLAELMAQLGVFEVVRKGEVLEWRCPDPLPLVSEQLPVPADFAEQEDRLRWERLTERAAQAIIRHVVEELGRPDSVLTSIGSLSEACDLLPEDTRHGLQNLLDVGDFRLVDGPDADARDTDPETVPENEQVVLVPDWERFAEDRISIRRG